MMQVNAKGLDPDYRAEATRLYNRHLDAICAHADHVMRSTGDFDIARRSGELADRVADTGKAYNTHMHTWSRQFPNGPISFQMDIRDFAARTGPHWTRKRLPADF